MKKCSYCDKELLQEDEVTYETNDGDIICEECYEDHYFVCERCGEIYAVDDIVNIGDKMICEDCLENNYFTCDDCGAIHHLDYVMDVDDKMICEDCLENNYFACGRCDEFHRNDDMYYIEDEGESWCQRCYSVNGWCCNSCGNYYSFDAYCDYNGDCENCSCSSESHPLVDDGVHPNFFPDSFPRKHIGMEFEVDKKRYGENTNVHDCVDELYGSPLREHIYFKSDGSLNYGVEIVSHPHHIESYLDGGDFDLNLLRTICLRNNLYSHDTSTCGLHMHFSREWWDDKTALAKTLLFFDKWWDEVIVPFSRRKDFAYCEPSRNLDDYLYFANDGFTSRYRAVNLNSRDTIEFRVAKGSLNVKTIRATMQFYAHIISKSNTLTWEECENLDNWMSDMPANVLEYLKGRNVNVKESD